MSRKIVNIRDGFLNKTHSFWQASMARVCVDSVFAAVPEYRCPLRRPRFTTSNWEFGVYLIVTQGNGSLYPLDDHFRSVDYWKRTSCIIACLFWLVIQDSMGKCLLHVDSYLLFLFLDYRIKKIHRSKKIYTKRECKKA